MTHPSISLDDLVSDLYDGKLLAETVIAGSASMKNIERAALVIAAAGRRINDVIRRDHGYIILFDVMWPVYGRGDIGLHLSDPVGDSFRLKLINEDGWYVEQWVKGDISTVLMTIFEISRYAESQFEKIGYHWVGDY